MARILFVSPIFVQSGPVYVLLKLLKYTGQQHNVAVVAPGTGELFEELEKMGIPGYLAEPHGLTRRSIPWLCRLIRRGEFDLVYGCGYLSGTRNALLAAKLAGRPFIWHINEMLKKTKTQHWRKAFFLPYADIVISDSQASDQSIKHHVPPDKVHLVYNGVDLDEFDLDVVSARQHVRRILGVSPEQLVVLNAGLVCPRKGQGYSIKAAVAILKAYPEVTFAFLGGLDLAPDYANLLTSQVADLGLEDRIQFLGFRTDFPLFVVGSDIFLHTAVQDPHPIVVLSAMAARLPVMAFAVDGVKEQVVDGETGYLVPFGDVDAMVLALKKCLDSPALRRRMGELGRKRVETLFTATEMSRRIGELIDDLLAKGVRS